MKFSKSYLVGAALLCVVAGRLVATESPQPFAQKHGGGKISVPAEWVAEEGARFGKSPMVTAESIRFSAKAKLLAIGAKPTEDDISALAYKIMVLARAQSNADLKASMAAMKKTTEEKKAQREAAARTMQPDKPVTKVGQLRDADEILLEQAKDRQARLDKMIAEAGGAKPRR